MGAHRRRRRARAPRGRCSTARRAGAARACTCPAPSSRCCRTRSPATPARCSPGSTAPPSRSSSSCAAPTCVRTAFYRSLIRSDECASTTSAWIASSPGTESAARAVGRAAAGRARMTAAALQQKRERRGARGRTRRARVLLRRAGQRHRDPRARADRVPPADRAPDDRRQRGRRGTARPSAACRASTACTSRPDPDRIERLVDQLASLDVPTPPLPEHMSATQAAELVGEISQRVDSTRAACRATGGSRSARSCCARSSRPTTRRRTSATRACARPSYCHFTSPIRRYPDIVCHRALLSAVGAGELAPRAGELVELGAWTSEREREAMTIERDADDVARCFALEQMLYERGHDRSFTGEITGLISAGAFVAFGARGARAGRPGVAAPPFEGMVPVRSTARPCARSREDGASGPARRGTGRERAGAAGARRGRGARARRRPRSATWGRPRPRRLRRRARGSASGGS